jgi:glycosyltransferase involved in cell wall biosynthesis
MEGPVLYVLKRFPRLSETFVLNEILLLRALGVHVVVDALSAPEAGPWHPGTERVIPDVRYLPSRPRLRAGGVLAAHLRVALRHPMRWVSEARRSRRESQWRRFLQAGLVADRARALGVVHIHAHFATAAAQVAISAARMAGLRSTVTTHAKDMFHAEHASSSLARLGRADGVITVSKHNVGYLRDQLPAAGQSVHLVRNGVSLARAADPAAAATILAVARLVPKKGLDLLVEAAALLVPRYPGLQVDIIGAGPLMTSLTERIQELGLTQVVRLRGPATSEQVFGAMAASRAVVLPCRVDADGDRDGLPTVLVEALARAVPVVSTDVAGIGELVRDGETGLLVPPEDPDALATALSRLLDDGELARDLGRAGRRLVAAEYNPVDSATALAQIFADVRGLA